MGLQFFELYAITYLIQLFLHVQIQRNFSPIFIALQKGLYAFYHQNTGAHPAHDFQRSFVIISRERIDHLCAEDDRDIRQNNLHERTENPTDDQPRVTFPDHGHNLFSHIAFVLFNFPHNPHSNIIFTAFKSGHSFSAGRKTIHNIAPSLSSELHGFRTPPISHGRLTRSDRIF